MCPNVLGGTESFVVGDGLHPFFTETLDGVGVLSEIELRADQNDRNIGSVVADLRVPLQSVSVVNNAALHQLEADVMPRKPPCQVVVGGEVCAHLSLDVIKRWRADDGEADEEDIGLGVGERSESVVIFLSSSIP